MRKFISYLLVTLTVFGFNFYNIEAKAYDNIDSLQNFDIMEIEKQTSIEASLPNGVRKKDDIIYFEYDYGQSFAENNYKYKTVRVETTYYDMNSNCNNVIAAVYMEFHFRYNTELNEAKCLSTTHGQICNSKKYDLKVVARTKNLSYDTGESFGSIDFIKNGIVSKQIDDSNIIFCCDSSGNIIHRIQQT